MKSCSKCKESKELTEFYVNAGKPGSYCKPCARAATMYRYRAKTPPRERVIITGRTKECTRCKETKHSSEFYVQSKNKNYLQSECCQCARARGRERTLARLKEGWRNLGVPV